MADGYIKAAEEYATQAANTYRNTFDNTLQDLLTTRYNSQKEQATNNYNKLLNQINANRANLREQYKTNTRQAYVNKLLADQQTTDTLSRMNLNQSGFRLTQDTLTNNRYDASLNDLTMAMNAGERDLDTKALDALSAHNNNLLNLDIDYNSRLGELLQDKENKIQEYYDKVYDRYIADRQYQDQLKQQEFENSLRQKQVALSSSSKGSTSFGGGGSANVTPEAGSKDNPYLKYNWEAFADISGAANKNRISLTAQMALSDILKKYGTRDKNGYYDVKNTTVSQYDLLTAIAEAELNGKMTEAEGRTILEKVFGYSDKIKLYPQASKPSSKPSGTSKPLVSKPSGTRYVNKPTSSPYYSTPKSSSVNSVNKFKNILDSLPLKNSSRVSSANKFKNIFGS